MIRRTRLGVEALEDRRTPAATPTFVAPRVPDQAVELNVAPAATAFAVADADAGQTATLVVTGTSSDTTLLPNADIQLTGTGGNWTLRLVPAAGRTGRATVTLRVTDVTGRSATDQVVLTVRGFANDAPKPGSAGVTASYKNTNYALPTAAANPGGVYYVAPAVSTVAGVPAGSASNTGLTPASPWTVDKALDAVAALPYSRRGQNVAIVFRGGDYRGVSRQSPYLHDLVLQAYPDEKPVLKGTRVVTDWTADGAGHWSTPSAPAGANFEFTTDPASSTENLARIDPAWNPFSRSLEQVFFTDAAGVSDPKWQVGLYTTSKNGTGVEFRRAADDVLLATRDAGGTLTYNPALPNAQAAYDAATSLANNLALLDAGKFFVDALGHRVHVGRDPASVAAVELTAHRYALKLWFIGDGDDTAVRGLNFVGYAESGLMTGGVGMTVRDCTFAWNGLTGYFGQDSTPGSSVADNAFLANGVAGMTFIGGTATAITSNQFRFNNVQRTLTAWGAAGLKTVRSDRFLIRDNVSRGNYGSGIWLDIYPQRNLVVRNLVADNTTTGIFIEIGNDNAVAFNLVHHCQTGILVANSSNTRVFNNTVTDCYSTLILKDDVREDDPAPFDPRALAGITWDVYDNVVRNNVFAEASVYGALVDARSTKPIGVRAVRGGTPTTLPRTTATMLAALDYNRYFDTSTGSPVQQWLFWDATDDGTAGAGTANTLAGSPLGYEANGSAGDPLFVGTGATDWDRYRPQANSPVVGAGAAVPADILAAVGRTGTSPRFVGALGPAGGANLPPTASSIPDATTQPGVRTAALNVSVADWETPSNALTLTRATSNATLLPLAGVVFGGAGAARTVTVTPAAGQTGTATVTVTVSDGSLSTSRTFTVTVQAAPTVTGVVANGGAAQRSTLTAVTVTFSGAVTIDAGAFTFARTAATGGGAPAVSVRTAMVDGRTVATLSFATAGVVTVTNGSLPDGRYTLTVDATKVRDAGGNALNGGVSFTHTAGLFRLYGDANGDGVVNGGDYFQFRRSYGSDMTTWAGPYVGFLDSDGDGFINGGDYFQFRARYGSTI